MAELTPKQQLFVDEYMTNGFNATKAARTAGYSEATANEQGARLLANVSIKEEINKRCQDVAAEFPEIRKKVIEKLQRIAFSDLGDYLEYKTIKTLDETATALTGQPITTYRTVVDVNDSNTVDTSIIAEVEEKRDGFKFKRMDSLKALELLAKYTGLENSELEELKREIEEIKKTIGGGEADR